MDVITYQDEIGPLIKAGFPGEGSVMLSILLDISELGEVKETSIEISGDYQNATYSFYKSKEEGFLPVRILKTEEKTIHLPKKVTAEERELSDEAKLKMYLKLKEELEREQLI
ncbi:hypothetical protein [Algoriphagus hitonicola]|uniref:Uncharacterized protein n=1 Tax=Algoriphagus hitonicola TaxID=435880 RepID=A0A1I2UUM5_9BACT|nr:hypothetical protein [Algoriphagus hitonicola]SFG80792.1 hypothetical protein SAMN04487988_108145 [Algoriphagus hitonicola]